MKEEKLSVLIVNESDAKSIFSDLVSLGLVLGSFWLNYNYLGDSVILKIVLCILFFMWVWGRTSSKVKRMDADEALEYLKNREES